MTLDEWERWLDENDHIWRAFVKYTKEKISQGYSHYGAHAIVNRIRWDTPLSEVESGFKISNGVFPYLAREFHRQYPKHAGFFRCRSAEADKVFGL